MDVREPVSTTLGGRTCRRDALVRHFFGSYASGAGRAPGAFAPFEILGPAKWTTPSADGLRLWAVGADATEIFRDAHEEPVGPVPQSTFSQPDTADLVQNRSAAKIRVVLQNLGGRHEFFMDANQQVELYTDCVAVDIMLPRTFVEVPPRDVERSGLVSDILIGAYQWELEESRGMREVTYTTFHSIAGDAQPAIEIPPFAKQCIIYQSAAGDASVSWSQWLAPPSMGFELGPVPFIPGARKTEPEILLPSATHLQPDLSPLSRFFTIQWTIRP